MRLPGISPGCSDRERVRGAITTRCCKVIGPIHTGEKSFISLFFAMLVSSLWCSRDHVPADIEEVDAQLDRAAQDGNCLTAVGAPAPDPAAGQFHGAEARPAAWKVAAN